MRHACVHFWIQIRGCDTIAGKYLALVVFEFNRRHWLVIWDRILTLFIELEFANGRTELKVILILLTVLRDLSREWFGLRPSISKPMLVDTRLGREILWPLRWAWYLPQLFINLAHLIEHLRSLESLLQNTPHPQQLLLVSTLGHARDVPAVFLDYLGEVVQVWPVVSEHAQEAQFTSQRAIGQIASHLKTIPDC